MKFEWPLIGHENVKHYFEKALTVGRVHHAYLFEGPAQVGKATLARLLSKTLLCDSEKIAPCGSCRACAAFEHSAHPDYLALERGDDEHISIEKAREYIAALATRPLLGSVRIGMIEEASALTAEAASALLKTIEEPGASVVIFLVADRPVLPTLASHCQRIRFGLVSEREIKSSLEGVAYSSEITSLSAGRPGRAREMAQHGRYEAYLLKQQEALKVLSHDEKERLLWILERFSGRSNAALRRESLKDFLDTLQYVLRPRLPTDRSAAHLLRRTLAAQEYLRANCDPKLICEYLLLL